MHVAESRTFTRLALKALTLTLSALVFGGPNDGAVQGVIYDAYDVKQPARTEMISFWTDPRCFRQTPAHRSMV